MNKQTQANKQKNKKTQTNKPTRTNQHEKTNTKNKHEKTYAKKKQIKTGTNNVVNKQVNKQWELLHETLSVKMHSKMI